MASKIYIVETVSVFRHTYYVKAKEAAHAMDEVVCGMGTSDLIEGSQMHVGENISHVREVTEREFLKVYDQENEHTRHLSNAEKLKSINVIDYTK